MLVTPRHIICLMAAITLPFASCAIAADTEEPASGAFEIVQPPAGYVIEGPKTYYQGATADVPFQLQGDQQVNGYVRVSFKKGKNVYKFPKAINITSGYLEAPLTLQLDKLRNGTHTLKVVFYNEKGQKADEVTRKITLVKAKKPYEAKAEEQDDPESELEEPEAPAYKSAKSHKADKSGKADKFADVVNGDDNTAQNAEEPTEPPAKRSIFWKGGRKRCLGCSRW